VTSHRGSDRSQGAVAAHVGLRPGARRYACPSGVRASRHNPRSLGARRGHCIDRLLGRSAPKRGSTTRAPGRSSSSYFCPGPMGCAGSRLNVAAAVGPALVAVVERRMAPDDSGEPGWHSSYGTRRLGSRKPVFVGRGRPRRRPPADPVLGGQFVIRTRGAQAFGTVCIPTNRAAACLELLGLRLRGGGVVADLGWRNGRPCSRSPLAADSGWLGAR